ncbi:hypothetical protein C7H09_01755 [Marinobacter fuscus]|uniref:Uncharacterized protein n=1 Tax=Marinobacter fuscus TaxID=2109942 RepID=A0A2T1KTE0_9GAMM|nr:hypothetical protein [Marinobacter fuscus]PSF13361.1 hypothetical protein C7H09_01755 [Marinobacter fuscus]
MTPSDHFSFRKTALATLVLSLGLTGCGGDSSSTPLKPVVTKDYGIVATAADDYTAGEVELISVKDSDMTASGGYFSGISDITVNGRGQHYYLIRKFNGDQVLKVDIENPAKEVWDASTLEAGDQGSANPYQIVFASDSKAYLLRYGKNEAWVVNPSATQAEDFFTGETLNLEAYMPEDSIGAVNMSSGVVVDGKLFVTLQRLDSNYSPSNQGYVAVFDTATDTEIETNANAADNLKGIPLKGTNPSGIQHVEGIGLVVTNVGAFSAPFDGTSLDIINPQSYQVSSMIADADIDTQINDAVIISNTQGYILNYSGWQSIALQSFDPSVGAASLTTINDLSGADLRDIELSPQGRLWLADASLANPGIHVIDISDNTEADFIETSLLPITISFGSVVSDR